MAHSSSSNSDDLVVFSVLRETECAECGQELWRGAPLRLENEQPLCLSCADLDHLVFLPTGNTALTRRAGKYSTLRAVVLRFSRARKRYERRGTLVEEAALERAETECLADADARARARERAAQRREREDARYVEAFANRVGELYPGSPPDAREAIARHACLKYSGRIGRSAEARALEPHAIDLAVRAHVRHAHTDYDALLNAGWERSEARAKVAGEMEALLERWRG